MTAELAIQIDSLLPQTQCTRCGYPACRPYADAIAHGHADIDQCPPGGQAGVDALANLLGRATKPLNPLFGIEAPATVALIDEDVCIGCTKCIQACPVDAIVGAAKRMHAIIASECTGCELCIPPCPVDCIEMLATARQPLPRADMLARAAHARMRFDNRNQRLKAIDLGKKSRRDGVPRSSAEKLEPISRNAVLEAIARGKAKRAIRSRDSDEPGIA
jgi:Na+-translocating ferredoxin:NAD+ oxidoreductase subunit B